MDNKNYTASFLVEQTPTEVFRAITDVRSWWTGDITGETHSVGDEFVYTYKDVHRTKQQVTELVLGKKVVWHVLEAHLSFAKDPEEWVGTDIIFDITQEEGKTKLSFSHIGLVPALACYGSCSMGWDAFINGNLKSFIQTGEVQKNPFEK